MSDEKQASAQDTPKAESPEQATAEKLYDKTDAVKPQAEAAKPQETKAEGKAPEAEAGKEKDAVKADDKAAAAPDKYELKLPKDSQLGAADVEKIEAYAKAQGLSKEQAQALLERENSMAADFRERQLEQYEQTKTQWYDQVQKDPEISGKENAELASRVVKRFGSQAFIETLNESGLGNHPELVRVFVKIGKSMGEDKLVPPGAQASQPKSIEEVFYGAKQ